MHRVLLDEVIHTSYGQFELLWADSLGFDGNFDRFFAGQVNGLVGAAEPNGVYINLARYGGGSRVRLTVHDGQPPLPTPDFEDVVEVSIAVPAGATVQWAAWGGTDFGEVTGLQPGTYRLRVSAHGRDAGAQGEFAEGIVDEYLLELWPAAADDDEVVRVGSENARYWHREVGGRR